MQETLFDSTQVYLGPAYGEGVKSEIPDIEVSAIVMNAHLEKISKSLELIATRLSHLSSRLE